ncbi:hypothetical protein L1887_48928 [Cichorium endivia]|nr:hypothetical protein L1887_48928 [Cichorium endivia]
MPSPSSPSLPPTLARSPTHPPICPILCTVRFCFHLYSLASRISIFGQLSFPRYITTTTTTTNVPRPSYTNALRCVPRPLFPFYVRQLSHIMYPLPAPTAVHHQTPLPPPGNDAAAAPPAFPATRLPPPLPSQSLATQQASSSATSSALSHPIQHSVRLTMTTAVHLVPNIRTTACLFLPHRTTCWRHASLGDELIQRNPSSSSSPSSFFNDQQISASPDSSPRLEAAPIQMPRHTPLRHQHPCLIHNPRPRLIYTKSALRRASIAMGVDIEQVRDHCPSRHGRAPRTRAPTLFARSWTPTDSSRIAHTQPLVVRESWQAEPPRSNARNHAAYPSRYADPGPASRSAYPAYHELARGDSVASARRAHP